MISRILLYRSLYTAIELSAAWYAAVMDEGRAETGCSGDGRNGRWMYDRVDSSAIRR